MHFDSNFSVGFAKPERSTRFALTDVDFLVPIFFLTHTLRKKV